MARARVRPRDPPPSAPHPLRAVARLQRGGVPAARLAHRWGGPQRGVVQRLPSSPAAIHDLGAQGPPAGTVVPAEEQTAGRGRDGRTWHSGAGGVWLGMLFRPAQTDLSPFSLRAGLVVADVVDEQAGRTLARLKWPNDVVVGDRGRKLAGILCEGRWQGEALQWLALGVGGDVANPIPPAPAHRAATLTEFVPAGGPLPRPWRPGAAPHRPGGPGPPPDQCQC